MSPGLQADAYTLLRVQGLLQVFLILLFWLLQRHFHGSEFFRWWTAAWISFGFYLGIGHVALAMNPEGASRNAVLLAATLAGFLHPLLLVWGTRLYEQPQAGSRTQLTAAGAGCAALAVVFFWWSLLEPLSLRFAIRNGPRQALLAAALSYCAWVFLGRWRRAQSQSAVVTAGAFLLSGFNEVASALRSAAVAAGGTGGPLRAVLGPTEWVISYNPWISLIWPMALSAGMILLLLEEHQRSVAEQQATQRALNAALRASPDCITITTLDGGRCLEANDAFLALTGYRREEVIGRSVLEMGLWADPAERMTLVQILQERGTVQNFEIGIRTRDGRALTMLVSADLMEIAGQPHLLAISKDITDRKRAEEALRTSEERFSSAFRATPDAIALVSLAGRGILEVNESFVRLSGYSREEVLGRTGRDLNFYADPGAGDRLLEELQARGFVRDQEVRLRNKSGKIGIALLSMERISLGAEPGLIVVARDITEQKRAAGALQESEARYRDLVENATDIIFTLDQEGAFTSINKAGEDFTGYFREELIGSGIAKLLPLKDLLVAQDLLERTLHGEALPPVELEIQSKDGRRLFVELHGRPVVQEGRPAGLQAIARNITDRKELESQLRQAQKMEAVGQLAGGVAHDFNNILSVILGYSELLSAQLPAETPSGHKIREVHKAAARAAALTRQLLAFSRKQVLQPKILDLNHVVSEVEKLLRRLIGEHISLLTRLDSRIGCVTADPGQVEQVIINLAVNARDAMPDGGTLTISTARATLDGKPSATDRPQDSYVVLSVSDTGVGMDQTVQAKIFEPFFTTKEPGKGTGLGLATVYGIVAQSGGHIRVSSRPGAGARFDVFFPEISADAPHPRSAPAAVSQSRGSETILLVEDENALREYTRESLELSGFRVLSAASGVEAMELGVSYGGPIHLLLTDVVLPGISGVELAKRFGERRPQTKVLFMSGYADAQVGQLEPKAWLLQKPFRPVDLAVKVREVLDTAPV